MRSIDAAVAAVVWPGPETPGPPRSGSPTAAASRNRATVRPRTGVMSSPVRAVAPGPKRVESAAGLLIGERPEAAVFKKTAAAAAQAAEPICDIRGSADYRREIVGVMTRRALEKARQRSEEAGR